MQKLNSYFADFKQNKKMIVILLTFSKTKNVSYFSDFELLTQKCYLLS